MLVTRGYMSVSPLNKIFIPKGLNRVQTYETRCTSALGECYIIYLMLLLSITDG